MNLPPVLQGESLTRLLQGVALGAVATIVVGFYWGGWVLGSTADKAASASARTAVVAALAPICADNFQRSADASGNLMELKKVSSYQQSGFVEKGGWATLPGSDSSASGVAQACADILSKT
jgi:hypothetical protein